MKLKKLKRAKAADKTTRRLMDAGVVRVQPTMSRQGAQVRHGSPYSFTSAVWYTFALSLVLWWMPTFGQMIAGYVGGRRAGGPWKGIIAAFIPVAIFLALTSMADHGILTAEISYVASVPSQLAAGISANIPVLAPYIDFAGLYVTTFVESLSLTLGLGLNGYLVTVIFAYIGGIVSAQRRRETELTRSGIPTVIATPTAMLSGQPAPTRKSWYDSHGESLSSMKKVPVKSSAPVQKSVPKAKSAPKGKPKPKQKKRAAKDKEKIGQKLAERAMRNYR